MFFLQWFNFYVFFLYNIIFDQLQTKFKTVEAKQNIHVKII